ncbi:TetR/AcrR family transcriptional regulator [Streptomyces sp. 5K101]|uniref:TetR/AcrR family transcriptional regulator n=1 Tax=Streptomyces sp. 5K101 TaxID=3390037 RepID=UPI0039752077
MVLDARIIVDAALALCDEQGAEALTVRKLAARLGVDPSSLYRHVADKDELHLLLADRLFEEILETFAPPPGDWRRTLRDLAVRTRETALRHPAAAVAATYRTKRRPAEMRIVEHILTAFAEAGCGPGQSALLTACTATSPWPGPAWTPPSPPSIQRRRRATRRPGPASTWPPIRPDTRRSRAARHTWRR